MALKTGQQPSCGQAALNRQPWETVGRFLPAFGGADEGVDLVIQVGEVVLGLIDPDLQLLAPVFHEFAEIRQVDGDVVHEAAAKMDVLLVHEGEDLLGPDVELLANAVELDLHGPAIILGREGDGKGGGV